jgi:hypothetical protein
MLIKNDDVNDTTDCFNRVSRPGEFEEKTPLWTFDDLIGLVRTALAGVGVVALIVLLGFWRG